MNAEECRKAAQLFYEHFGPNGLETKVVNETVNENGDISFHIPATRGNYLHTRNMKIINLPIPQRKAPEPKYTVGQLVKCKDFLLDTKQRQYILKDDEKATVTKVTHSPLYGCFVYTVEYHQRIRGLRIINTYSRKVFDCQLE